MPTRRTVLLATSAACLLPTTAWAHRVNRAESTILLTEDGRVEVTHIFHAADAQDALFRAGLIDRADIASLRARARLALHVEETFSLSQDGAAQTLETLGAELVGNSVYVYQEGELSGGGSLTVRAAMLHGLLHGQRNSVTVRHGEQRQTIELTKRSDEKTITL